MIKYFQVDSIVEYILQSANKMLPTNFIWDKMKFGSYNKYTAVNWTDILQGMVTEVGIHEFYHFPELK